MYKIITISREFGSGGRTIGKKLAAKLGYQFYDSDIVAKVAETSGYHPDFIEKHGEYASSGSSIMFSFSRNGSLTTGHNSMYDDIFIAQQKVILDIASKENAVIVGRCADYILRDRNDVFNVFIYSDLEKRKENIINEYVQIIYLETMNQYLMSLYILILKHVLKELWKNMAKLKENLLRKD